MTNEALAIKIKAGETHLMDELWSQVERFVYKQACRFHLVYKDRCTRLGLEREDLRQEGYIAIHEAVQGFNEEKDCSFLTYAGYHLKKQFFRATKMHSIGWQKNTIHQAVSLDEPTGEGETTRLDRLAETSGEDSIEYVIERDYIDRLAQDLNDALTCLTERQLYYVTQRYYENIRPFEIAKQAGVTRMTLNNAYQYAFKKLRARANLQGYLEDLPAREVKTA